MYAYDISYLDDAMIHLGEMLDYVVYDLHYDLDTYWQMFCTSQIGCLFSQGSPKYNAGMSGVELAQDIIHEKTGEWIMVKPSRDIDCSREYWTGWILAYYQHQRNIDFKRLAEYGLDASRVCDMYIFHEVDVRQFCDAADQIIELGRSNEENRLRRLRKYAQLTQKQLSEKSGVTLRMIQLYEQGQNDISKAQVSVVLALAQSLNCSVEDLIP